MIKLSVFLLPALFLSLHLFAQVPADSTSADSALLRQVEEQMLTTQPAPQVTRSAISANPDIGVVGDFRASYLSSGKKNLQ